MVIFFCAPSDISTHALTEGDTETLDGRPVRLGISTHALTEGDSKKHQYTPTADISTHALTEGDLTFHLIVRKT